MLFEDSYKTIQAPATGQYKEKGSRFMGFAYHAVSEDEIKKILQTLKKEHHQASHHCYAFRIGPPGYSRFSDDREPSGTAGRPILSQLQLHDLTDVLLVVARYFGGSLLGVPGLINAYRTAAANTIENSEIVKRFIMEKFRVKFAFDSMNEIMGLLKSYSATVINLDASGPCIVDFEIKKSLADEILQKIRSLYNTSSPPEIIPLPFSQS